MKASISLLKPGLLLQLLKATFYTLLCLLAMQAAAKPPADNKASSVQREGKGSKLVLNMPSANPYALSANSGTQTVRFSVAVREFGTSKSPVTIYLRHKGDKQSVAMNDLGKNGDFIAKDGIVGVNVQIDTRKIKSDTCLNYEAFAKIGREELTSSPLRLCVSSFPIHVAVSNIANPVVFPDGTQAVADEVLIITKSNTNAPAIRRLAASINANVVGSILPLNRYQLKLSVPVKADQLLSIVSQLSANTIIENASINAIGQGALNVDDPAFDLPLGLNSQHGLKQVIAHDQTTEANAWDSAIGTGLTAVVLDTGLALPHPDLDPSWTCQLATGSALVTCSDTTVAPTAAGHGTQVAGVLAAETNNLLGVAGAAHGSNVHSIKMSNFTITGMEQAFTAAAAYVGMNGTAQIINASFNVQDAFSNMTPLCTAINNLVLNGGVPRAVVIVAAGNSNQNGASYPARCNDLNALPTNKNLLITVSNSTSIATRQCGNASPDPTNGLNQRCLTDLDDALKLGSNFGAWVDMAAPGSSIRTTTIGNAYASSTGTSFSAPMVSGAVAILKSCGVPLDQIETALKGPASGSPGANVFVPYPVSGANPAGSTPRLDIALALQRTNCSMVAVDDVLSPIAEDSGVQTIGFVALTGNDNDGDPEAVQALTITAVSNPIGGAVSLDGMGNVLFTPTANFNGAASFDYTVQDNGQTNGVNDFKTDTGSVSFPVSAVNDAPVATNDTLATTEDTTVIYTAVQLLGNDSDVEGSALTIANVTSGTGGTATLNGDGTVTFTPSLNFNGAADFTYTASDGALPSNVATVAVNVTPVNDTPTGIPIINPPSSPMDRQVGDSLTVDISTIADEDVINTSTLQYQWFRNQGLSMSCIAPGAATGLNSSGNYTLVSADFSCRMSVTVTYNDSGLQNESVSSNVDGNDVGDPHIKTVDGLRYDFQAAGEFVMLRGADGLEIQIRQTPASTTAPLFNSYTGLTVGVSINTAVAARVGKHRVTYQPRNIVSATSGHDLRIDGVLMSLPANGIDLGSGGRITPLGNNVIQIDFPDETTMIVTPGWSWYNVWWLHVNILHTSAYDGLMGYRTKGSWLPRLSDGTSLGARPAAMHDRYVELYEKFANSWRVTNETSLFDYARDTSTRTFTLPAWPLEKPPYVIPPGVIPVWAAPQGVPAKPLKRQAALQHCRAVKDKDANANCVFDVMVAGNPGFAKTYLLQQKILAGLTAVGVRDDNETCKPNQPMFVLATVGRHTADTKQGLDKKGTSTRNVLSGTVQFTLDGKEIGKPIKLDGKGHAKMKMPCDRSRQQQVGARFIPAKGSVFLPSSSRNLSSNLETVLRQSKEKMSAN
ncbi:MAG: tandem-95 repeat protein [Candidatus Nitrotoga sp.]